ncbi:VCBS repeat-containing protein [Clostridium lacusfryxellense]|uniref:VCBS repeat-containing protein n=1 Tax=Clostridium lacusfryxellense TaxID=205328 RepID=UPI001C0D72C1|nr:VCBS repeat-containing protein [Clostridium lacusfryxellense]MBU3114353.1 VCBS repeat-containing protein [Clostridium lacusfryxellense]
MYNYYNRANMIKPKIVSYARGDVDGDGVLDNAYLTGIKTQDSPFVQDITLLIQDGVTGRVTSISLSENAGYDPSLFLGDFTGERVDDILIGINSGGSGAIMYYYIYSFINKKVKLLFDFNLYNEKYKYDVTYKDNYKVEVISHENNNKYIIDISNRDSDYLNEIYDSNGKLKNPINGFVNPLSGLYPVDFDSNKVYELLAYQKIAGRYNADSLGYVMNTMKWKDNVFILDNQYVAIFGSPV